MNIVHENININFVNVVQFFLHFFSKTFYIRLKSTFRDIKMARKTEQKHKELKEKIIVATQHIIAEEGLQGFNIRKVAKQVGCAVGMPYKIFKDSDEIIIHVNARSLENLHTQLKKLIENNKSDPDIAYQVAHAYLRYHKENPHFWSALFEHRYGENFETPPFYDEKINALFSLIQTVIPKTQGQDDNSQLTAIALWAGLHGICSLSLNGSLSRIQMISEEKLIDTLVGNYFSGLKK